MSGAMTYRQSAIRSNLLLRARIAASMRRFFDELGYLEVETPVCIPAPAPEAHIDAEACGQWYLQTSPELCMKRLLAAGYERIYQICRCFRRKERGSRHLPELTLLEWYTADADYASMMAQTETLVRTICATLGKAQFDYQGMHIDLSAPWPRLTVAEAFRRYAGHSPEEALRQGRFDEVLAFSIEPHLGHPQPLFLYDYPVACGALARAKRGAPHLVERFELYIAGVELCNGFSELTDPAEQRDRFERELAARRTAGRALSPMPEKFLAALADMPPAAGNALGVDRLVMLLVDAPQIDEVVAFTPEEL
jgi:elongation factor P--(R)-beta-lysine ligase